MKLAKICLTLVLSLSLISCKKKTHDDTTTETKTTKKIVTTKKGTTKKGATTKKGGTTSNSGSTTHSDVLKSINFGTYPQTLETSASIISALEEKITAFDGIGNAESRGWIKQIDYASNSTREAYYYRDIDLDDDGIKDYRAIHIYKYKNYNTTQSYEPTSVWWHDKELFAEGNTYYFKYEEIKWDVLEQKDGKAYLYTSFALDAQFYEACSDKKDSEYIHRGKKGYANNYELSAIRKWLNEDFYNLAFSDLEKTKIEQISVNNGLSSTTDTTNPYVCGYTNDYVFLLSEKELVTYFPTTESRKCDKSILTDYAKIQDADFEQILLRTPDDGTAYEVKVLSNCSNPCISEQFAYYALNAIRPVIVITL